MATPKICKVSARQYTVTDIDIAFLQKMSTPVPSLCPDERARRRLSWRNERCLYKRRCDKSGQEIVSIHSSDKPYPVWSNHLWWSDNWDAREFGLSFDFSRSFFDQFADLYRCVPQQAAQHSKSENCDYTNQSQCNKDCYLIVASNFSQDCLYGMWYQHCEDCVDCLYLEKSQRCYEIVNGSSCFECSYSQNVDNCTNVHFCKNCIGCAHCVGSVNLRNKEFYFFNQKCERDEYFHKFKELALGTRSGVERTRAAFQTQVLRFPHQYYVGRAIEDSTGDYLQHVLDTHDSYNCRHCEHIRYCRDAWKARNCYDLVETLETDHCLELEGCWSTMDCAFSMKLNHASNVWYSSHCFSSHDLFGCVGLRHGEYCILNRQYSRDEYLTLRAQIVEYMRQTGEWGEFFPANRSFFGYNETVAHEYFPLTPEECSAEGLTWKTDPTMPEGNAMLRAPDSIKDVGDQLLKQVLVCEETGRMFRITTAELGFYRKVGVPIPSCHHDRRHLKRAHLRNPRALHDRLCPRCGTGIQSTYAREDPREVLCEACYLQAVN